MAVNSFLAENSISKIERPNNCWNWCVTAGQSSDATFFSVSLDALLDNFLLLDFLLNNWSNFLNKYGTETAWSLLQRLYTTKLFRWPRKKGVLKLSRITCYTTLLTTVELISLLNIITVLRLKGLQRFEYCTVQYLNIERLGSALTTYCTVKTRT